MPLIAGMVTAIAVTGCIDDKYDLSDIDTTVKVNVDNLTVPVNIDEITLKSIFDLKDDSKIKEIDGVYAFVEDGTFDSKEVRIDAIHVASPNIKPTTAEIHLPANLPAVSLDGKELTFDVGGESTDFTASTSNVSSSIVALNHAGTTFSLDIVIAVNGLEGKVGTTRLRGLEMQLPRGLEIAEANGRYDAQTGVFTVGDVTSAGSSVKLTFNVTGIDFNKAGVTYDYARHYMSFSDRLSLKKAVLVFQPSDILVPLNQLPSSFKLVTSFNMSDININSFSGRVKYDIDGFNISDVNLTDLPDVLTQAGTDIRIANPQIYVSLTNPVNRYALKAQTGLTITSYRDNQVAGSYSLDAPGVFNVEGVPGVLDYNYYLSPSTVTTLYPGYPDARHVGYSSLSNVLSGDGIPTRLSINFDNPCIPEQNVNDISLGTSLGVVKGKYTFFAPLQLGAGSTVVYTDCMDGWSSEDLDYVTIQTLEVNMNVTTNVPIALRLTGYPVDKDGKQIGNVEIDGADINANADNQPVKLRITGEVKGIDGIRFTARAEAAADGKALAPGMTIKLSNVRPVVNGYYEKEL